MTFEAENAEVSPTGGKIGIGYFFDSFKAHMLFYGLVVPEECRRFDPERLMHIFRFLLDVGVSEAIH